MNAQISRTRITDASLRPSATGAEGFAFLVLYDETPEADRSVSGQPWGPLTSLGTFEPDSTFVPLRIVSDVCEIWVKEGSMKLNHTQYREGDWLPIAPGNDHWLFGSDRGCQILTIARGQFYAVSSSTPLRDPPAPLQPATMPWVSSPTGLPGLFSKKVFEYTTLGLGRDGRAGSYTTFYRMDAGTSYPPWRLTRGVCEIWVLDGTLTIDDDTYQQDEWLVIPATPAIRRLSSSSGCELLVVMRGEIELVQT